MGVGPEVGERVDRQDAAILVGRLRQRLAEVADRCRAGGAAIGRGRCRGGGNGGGRGAGEFEGVAGGLVSLACLVVGGLGRRLGRGPLRHGLSLWLGRRLIALLLIAECDIRRFLVGRRLLGSGAPERRQQADDTHDHDRSLEPHLDALQGVLREKPGAALDTIPLSKAIAWPARGTDSGGQNLRDRFPTGDGTTVRIATSCTVGRVSRPEPCPGAPRRTHRMQFSSLLGAKAVSPLQRTDCILWCAVSPIGVFRSRRLFYCRGPTGPWPGPPPFHRAPSGPPRGRSCVAVLPPSPRRFVFPRACLPSPGPFPAAARPVSSPGPVLPPCSV